MGAIGMYGLEWHKLTGGCDLVHTLQPQREMFLTCLPTGTSEGYAIGNSPRLSKNTTTLIKRSIAQSYEDGTEGSHPLSVFWSWHWDWTAAAAQLITWPNYQSTRSRYSQELLCIKDPNEPVVCFRWWNERKGFPQKGSLPSLHAKPRLH